MMLLITLENTWPVFGNNSKESCLENSVSENLRKKIVITKRESSFKRGKSAYRHFSFCAIKWVLWKCYKNRMCSVIVVSKRWNVYLKVVIIYREINIKE